MAEIAPVMLSESPAVRRGWCVKLAVALVFLGAILNTIYLYNYCPINLSGDEAHYWEWSRHLDYGYYSKPPGIAWVMAATVRIGQALGVARDNTGEALMPLLRTAAVVFGVLSGLLTIALARRIFRDDRAGLAVIVLSAAVPMFAVGSLLITIDSPMYLCWAATVYCLWRAVEWGAGEARIRWLYLAGAACAAGMLFKPVLIAIPACVIIGMIIDPAIRRTFKTGHSLGAVGVMLLSQVPVLIWNSQHNWVTLRHMLTQAGVGKAAASKGTWVTPLARVGEYVGGQAGGMGGIMFVLLVIAVGVAVQKVRRRRPDVTDQARTAYRFLLSFALPLWLFYFVLNFWTGTEVNWPAASYFAGMILLAGLFVEGWNSVDNKVRKTWRTWGTVAIVWGVVVSAFAMNTQRAYPWVARALASKEGTEAYFSSWLHPLKWDQPTVRLRGLAPTAAIAEAAVRRMAEETGAEPLLISNRYDTASALSFYMPGHPAVYCIMSSVGGRQNQYDFWPGLNQKVVDAAGEHLRFAGRPAVIVGGIDRASMPTVRAMFERFEGPELYPIVYQGVELRSVYIYRGYGFKGLSGGPKDVY